jgi:hypothetical protein
MSTKVSLLNESQRSCCQAGAGADQQLTYPPSTAPGLLPLCERRTTGDAYRAQLETLLDPWRVLTMGTPILDPVLDVPMLRVGQQGPEVLTTSVAQMV